MAPDNVPCLPLPAQWPEVQSLHGAGGSTRICLRVAVLGQGREEAKWEIREAEMRGESFCWILRESYRVTRVSEWLKDEGCAAPYGK